MASLPPNRFGGPPPGPTPVGMSAMRVPPMQSMGGGPESEPSSGGGGLAKMFYAIEQGLDSLAGVIPDEAEQLDKLKAALREILARAVSNGAAFVGTEDRGLGIRNGPSEPLI